MAGGVIYLDFFIEEDCMKKFAKMSAVLAAMMLALAFSGCSDSDDDDDDNDVHVSYPSNSESSGGNSSASSDSLDVSKLVGTWSFTDTNTYGGGYYSKTKGTMEITGTEPNSKVSVYILEDKWYDDEDDGESCDYSDKNDGKGKLDEYYDTFKDLMEYFFYVPKKGEKEEVDTDDGIVVWTCTSSSVTQTDNKITISYTAQSDDGEKSSYSIVAVKK